jgi:hypothetical protein
VSIWKVIFATLVIFGAGVITGVLGYNRFYPPAMVSVQGPEASVPQSPINPWPHVTKGPQGTNSPVKVRNDFLTRFGKQLELTPEQSGRIEQILSDSQKRTKEISDGIAPFLREEVRHTRELIRTELTPEQSRKYDEMVRPNKQKKKEEMPVKGFPRKVAKQEVDG